MGRNRKLLYQGHRLLYSVIGPKNFKPHKERDINSSVFDKHNEEWRPIPNIQYYYLALQDK